MSPWACVALAKLRSEDAGPTEQERLLTSLWDTSTPPTSLLRHDVYVRVDTSNCLAVTTLANLSRQMEPTRDDVELTWLMHRKSVYGEHPARQNISSLLMPPLRAPLPPSGSTSTRGVTTVNRCPESSLRTSMSASAGTASSTLPNGENVQAHLAWAGLDRVGDHPVMHRYEVLSRGTALT